MLFLNNGIHKKRKKGNKNPVEITIFPMRTILFHNSR